MNNLSFRIIIRQAILHHSLNVHLSSRVLALYRFNVFEKASLAKLSATSGSSKSYFSPAPPAEEPSHPRNHPRPPSHSYSLVTRSSARGGSLLIISSFHAIKSEKNFAPKTIETNKFDY